MHELQFFHYNVAVLCETWLKPNVPNRLLVFPGYSLHRSDRKFAPKGYGGVAVLSRDGIEVKKIGVPASANNLNRLESLWSLFRWDRSKIVIGAVYRQPRNTSAALDADFDDLEWQYQHVILNYPDCAVVIAGDLNCDMLGDGDAPARRRLTAFLSAYSLTQTVTEPTFSSGSLLDVFIINRDLCHRTGTRHCHFSPHKFIRMSFKLPKSRHIPTVVRSRVLRRVDTDAYHRDLAATDWSAVLAADSVAVKWELFSGRVRLVIDEHAPFRDVRLRNPVAPPVSDQTRGLIVRRGVALRAGGHASAEYRQLNRKVRSAIRADNRRDITDRIRDDGPSALWRHMRHIITDKRPSRGVLPAVTPDVMNDYFVGVGLRVAAEVAALGAAPEVPVRLPRVGACAFSLHPITLSHLHLIIFNMRNTSACGTDGPCIRILKLSFDIIGPLLLHIINSSITFNEVPAVWKHALVHPIHKSGDPDNPSNFRPISILPVIAKVVEKVVQHQLHHYLASNHLLSPSQHGFRPRHSTETALINISDRVFSAMDQSQISLLCLIDLSRCFDVINHAKLLEKLQLHCIDTSWFSNYLSGHTQSVSLSSTLISASRPITQGVFQGSSLGPLLFTVFANDLSLHAAGAFVTQYADDTQVLVSGPKSALPALIGDMEAALSSLDAYFRSNGLKVNETKFELLPIGTRQNLRNMPSFTVKFRNTDLVPGNEAKNIGITFDRYLSWDSHVEQLSRKCVGILTAISHLRHYLPPGSLPTLVSALVFSHIHYGLAVYGNGSSKNLATIQKVFNFAARIISGKRKFDHISGVRDELGWLDSPDLVVHHTLTLLHKVRRTGQPESLAVQFCTNRERPNHVRSTRRDDLLSLPNIRGSAAGKWNLSGTSG